MKSPRSLSGHRVLILAGEHAGEEAICLGKVTDGDRWAVSPDSSNVILKLTFEQEFALLLDLSTKPSRN